MAIEDKLNEAIERHLDEMGGLGIGSEEMSKAIKAVAQLHALRIEEEKVSIENRKITNDETAQSAKSIMDVQNNSFEQIMRDEEMKERKRDRFFRIGVAAAEIILPLAVYTGLAMLGFAREFDGVITSDTLKRVLNTAKPKK